MSRFFTTGSDSESESSASGDELTPKPAGGNYSKPLLLSEDEEDTKRVVRSAKDKRSEELCSIIRALRNAMKIKDVSRCLEDFELLSRAFNKAKGVLEREGPPRFYIRILADLEDYLAELWEDKEGKRRMNKNNARALSSLRQKLRKHNREYEAQIAAYRQNPELSDEDEEKRSQDSEGSSPSPSSSGDEDDAGTFLKKRDEGRSRFLKGSASPSPSSGSGGGWGSSGSGSGSEEEDEGGEGKGTNLQLASRFLKRDEERRGGAERRRAERRRKRAPRSRREEEEDENEGGEWEKVKGGAPLVKEKPKMFAKGTEITPAVVLKKLNEILQARGKKGTDRAAQIELLQLLVAVANENGLGAALEIKIKFSIIASLYDYNPNLATYMKPELWQRCLSCIEELLDELFQHPEIFIGENILEESENLSNPDQPYRVRGCILTLVERMDEEFTKIMQNTDPHSQEYVEQLKDEARVCSIISRLQQYLQEQGSPEELCRVYLRRILHTYYKFDYGMAADGSEDSASLMDRLCKFIYAKDRTDRIRTCSILCHIYHHALHSRWYPARDLMLMSHLQDNIQHADPPVQILYNRTMVQLGICAFRQGLIKDAHNALLDIQSSGRAKELLGQGLLLRSLQERNPEQEKVEKRRQVPFHMHVNLELLECVYLVAAMLLEIPYMAAHEFDARRRMISKQFHHQLRVGERQPLLGPPESMREHVVAASKAMKMGDWRSCHRYVVNEKMNGKVWDLFPEADKVRAMLVRKIQEESLRTYLFTYSSVYDSISMEILSAMFELDLPTVHSIISKMIINEELMASLDQPTQTVQMHRTEPSAQQNLALQLAEKLGTLMENNERVLDHKQGSYGGYFRDQKDGYRKGDGGYLRRGGYRQQERGSNY
ncbi:eukaryotic translation initiation factor 3 subunit C-like isoform X4 [Melopsittacus undulatus]|uniref:eukaryotic translation initiation factor 3 subunit C-like isoform X1 n=1 Tax=Melopsittacus undulatus TaxID=13146 RepID=UPI00146CDB87|nr:eukaryotic translation initiation factor 3 subunit C-like isoform X1 [Melopsittacus undulatus]XP_033928376.1 eukaryotic translation initiation factor 3 subunit C-like isoform X2 [Melopsittacus undulatus]XP_033928377.1 eukaryotic translation initiation factor 3 subunit C-like isoform X3 [Melopsittacus undulatus]XP_033928378.1 eukaryotic translation initiation factor 3 subunit C-like isoform X4 [Melopsittacus undulatus]